MSATPWGAIGQTAVGLAQTIGGWVQQRKATKALEKMQSPTYTQNSSILDYYNKALQKYNVNPYQTDFYRMQNQEANRGLASGLNSLQGRGQALAGVSDLVRGKNTSMLKAGAEAEQLQRQDLQALGQASQLKAGEDRTAFDVNKIQPFERKYNLLAQKAGGGTQIANAGMSNIFGGLQSYDQTNMLNKMYGDSGGTTYKIKNQTPSMTNMSVYNSLLQNRNRRVG